MTISFVVAVAKNGVIGSNNDLPFYIPEDLKHFQQITTGRTVLMGRKTFESIIKRLGRPLPNRCNVVVTRQPDFRPEGVWVYPDLTDVIASLESEGLNELMVIGGAQIYQQLLESNKVDKIYMTRVHREVEGDVFFPDIDWSRWREISREDYASFSWVTYARITSKN